MWWNDRIRSERGTYGGKGVDIGRRGGAQEREGS